MSYVYGSIPFFECFIRAEYTRNLQDRHGEFYPAVAHAVRCVRGHSMWFQCILTKKYAGAAFMVPIEAIVWSETRDNAMSLFAPGGNLAQVVQPWDCFSSEFGVSQDTFVHRGRVTVLPMRVDGTYRFTIDSVGTDLAEYPDQHKALHVIFLVNGLIGAYPNNRLLWHDPAFWTTTTETPDFLSLGGEFRSER